MFTSFSLPSVTTTRARLSRLSGTLSIAASSVPSAPRFFGIGFVFEHVPSPGLHSDLIVILSTELLVPDGVVVSDSDWKDVECNYRFIQPRDSDTWE